MVGEQLRKLGAVTERSPYASAVIRAWNMMGGIDWAALPTVAELIGFEDVEMLIEGLLFIKAKQENG